MIVLVRVDDRLLHGQIICSWVPHLKADALIVASDDAVKDVMTNQIMKACACGELSVTVLSVDEAIGRARRCAESGDERAIVILGDIKDALRLYKGGVRFNSLNLGNVHHESGGRVFSSSVALNLEDEACIGELEAGGVEIDIRDVPGRSPANYNHRTEERKSGA